MVIRLYEENTNSRQVNEVVEVLQRGGIIIYPTDTIYAIGCALTNIKGMDQIKRITGNVSKGHNFSLICHDLSQLSEFTRPIPNHIFKLLKKNLPGPFTFILNGNNNLPKIFKQNKKTVGIRIPDNNIIRAIAESLGSPIVSTSIHDQDEIIEYTTDPELIYERFGDKIDLMVDGGFGNNIHSTVIDCTSDEAEIVREGAGSLSY